MYENGLHSPARISGRTLLDGVKTGDLTFSQDKSGGYLLTGQTASGVEVA